jgi:hypothetical protein
MSKKLLIISISMALGMMYAGIAYTQNEPATTEPAASEDTADESKPALVDETKTTGTVKTVEEGSSSALAPAAKSYTDGKTTFVNSKVRFKLTADDDLAIDKIQYRINDGELAVYESPFAIEKEGYHTISYYGIDKAGNSEPAKSYIVAVDNTGPEVVMSTDKPVKKIGEKIYYPKNVLFAINAKDAMSGVDKIEYSTDGTTYKEYVAPFAMPSEGTINLKARSVDNVGNPTEAFAFRVLDEEGNLIDMKEATILLATDSTPPTLSIKPDKELKVINSYNVASSDVKYSILAEDAESGVAAIFYRLDGKGDFIPYKDAIQFLTNGKHQIDARAVDKVGNLSDIVSFTMYVDILPPNSAIEKVDQ